MKFPTFLILGVSTALAQTPAPVPSENIQQLRAAAEKLAAKPSAAQIEEAAQIIAAIARKEGLSEQEKQALALAREVEQISREMLLGVDGVRLVGSWKVRSGRLTREGAAHFGRKDGAYRKFAFATYTVDGEWTLGIQFFEERAPADEVKPAKPRLYLLGPVPLQPGQEVAFSQSTGDVYFPVRTKANADGTIPIDYPFPGSAKSVTWKFGKDRVVTFQLSDVTAAYELVQSLPVLPKPPPPADPSPKPPPR